MKTAEELKNSNKNAEKVEKTEEHGKCAELQDRQLDQVSGGAKPEYTYKKVQ